MDAEKTKKSGTIYQELNKLLNLDGFGFEENSQSLGVTHPNNQKSQKIFIKGNTPEEIYRKGLEIEQKKLLQNKFFRTTDRGFQKALQYEAARLPAYIDYEGMEYYPIISSALDLFMEEATTIGLDGKMLSIYSNKQRIKSLLEDFFYNIVNVNVNLPFWTRNVCKYGDNFVLLYGERKKGITHTKQLVNYEIERFERIQNGKPVVKFKERMTGDEFNIFEIAHFRLLGDDKYLPYGSSVLNKVRRVFRQLVMAEDAMLTYRIVRAGEKKVFKIDVGNMDEDDIEEYIYKVATKFKRTPSVNPNNGQIDYRFNILGNDEDYFIPVRNSNTQTGIDTLPGAQNLDAIQDIEYLRDNLFIGLGIPKPFLSFQDAAGAGKNMAQFDIRFAKKINRIQQAMIQELNKMAMTHLYLLGYRGDDLNSFTLTLTNPSTQQELLKSELMRDKAQTYSELTRGENGIAAMSHTTAKRLIFNMTDKEIVDDLKRQKLEKVIMQEFQDAPVVIKNTGLFADIDKRFGEPTENLPNANNAEGEMNPDMPQNTITPPSTTIPDENAIATNNQQNTPIPPQPANSNTQGLAEEKKQNTKKTSFDDRINELVYGFNDDFESDIPSINKSIIVENNNIVSNLNNKAEQMINEIDNLLTQNNTISINSQQYSNDLEELNFDDIEEIDLN